MTLEERTAIQKRLETIADKHGGRLTAEAVVEDARSKSSPLHSRIFRESDRDAAHQHRLELARQMIRSVRINVMVDQRTVRVVGYVNDPAQSEGGYVATASLVNERERAQEVMLREFQRVESLIERSREIADVLGLTAELESMLANVQRIMEVTRKAA